MSNIVTFTALPAYARNTFYFTLFIINKPYFTCIMNILINLISSKFNLPLIGSFLRDPRRPGLTESRPVEGGN